MTFGEPSFFHSPCGLVRRLWAIVYDGLVVAALWMLATMLILPMNRGAAIGAANIYFQLYLLAVAWIYFAWCWRKGGQTLGMRAWKIYLIAPETPVSWRRTLVRFAVAWISALALGLGFFWSTFNPQRATWHDLASNTRLVVRTFSSGAPSPGQ